MKKNEDKTELGMVRIHNGVISRISDLATKEVKGVARMGSIGMAGRIAEFLRCEECSHGVKVEAKGNEIKVTVSFIVEYGASIQDTAFRVQENIKNSVEKLAGIVLTDVNVNVQGIEMPKKA